jgi:hypothetical protein
LEGEFEGKLPGERALARRFFVNAKTLSKALTDLAAEGLLDRSIGRGTYVKGTAPEAAQRDGRWLLVCDVQREGWTVVRQIRAENPEVTVVHDVAAVRPSFLRQFDAVIDFGRSTPEEFLRDLIVRNVPVVAIDREPDVYSMNVLGPDRAMAAAMLGRDLFALGHRDVVVVETMPRSPVSHAVKLAASRYAPGASVRICEMEEVGSSINGATAVLCDCPMAAAQVRARLNDGMSVCAVGCCEEDVTVSGYYAQQSSLAQATLELLRGPAVAGQRPAAVWLATRFVDRGTMGAVGGSLGEEAA